MVVVSFFFFFLLFLYNFVTMKWDELDEDSDADISMMGANKVAGYTDSNGKEIICHESDQISSKRHLRTAHHRAESHKAVRAFPAVVAGRMSRMRKAGSVAITAFRGAVREAVVNSSPVRWASNRLLIAQRRMKYLKKLRNMSRNSIFLIYPG
jgi:hypothetical protein